MTIDGKRQPAWYLAFAWLISMTAAASAADKPLNFTRDVKPILSNHCYKCHGPDADERKGGSDGLRLDTAEGAVVDLGGYAAIVPGDPGKSALISRVTSTDAGEMMPPPDSGRRLTEAEISILRAWIQQGANFLQHWSYVKPVRPAIPEVKDRTWPKTDVDNFILDRLEKQGMRPNEEADRYALARRVALDLTGLPPTWAEVEAFVKDPDPKAYEKFVDRILAKDAYGEYWAHMWLDLARYADSAGYADDPPRTIWLYRDYVIRSLNANKPFDQFTIEQIAGDLLPNPTEDQLTATAFHRNTLTNNEGGTNDEEFRNVAIVDRVNTTMAVWMGTTMSCAQCHNHKYDPLSQVDFFRMFAILNNTADADRRDESPLLSILTDEQKQQKAAWEEEIGKLDATLRVVTPELAAAQAQWEADFPTTIAWRSLKPASVKLGSGGKAEVHDDGRIATQPAADKDTYTLEVPWDAGKLAALRIESVPDATLPGQGAGHADGNFVISRVAASVLSSDQQAPAGRYVRIEIPGKQKILSLAEVELFRGTENVATKGEAKQSSTDYGGDAKLAIDGNHDGRYQEAKSTTHSAISDDPWWELDLKTTQSVDRIVIWNRTDAGTMERLADFKISLLDEKRQLVWHETVATPPKPSSEFSLSGQRAVEFRVAVADYSQDGFAPSYVLGNPDPKKPGWSVGGQVKQAHGLTLMAKTPMELVNGSKLLITIEQNSTLAKHTLGSFRLVATDDVRAEAFGRTPLDVVATLKLPAESRTPAQREALEKHFMGIASQLDPVRKQLDDLRKKLAEIQPITVPIQKELPEKERRTSKVQIRGNYLELGQEVTEGLPTAFGPVPDDPKPNRMTLAKWLVSEDNPLTARVIANRYWEQLFGIGIVATSEEFGAQGDLPWHPELLDYLATELHRMRWDLKAFVKLLVMSAAYRQSSRVSSELEQRDPENHDLAHGPRFRLSAETVRDQALAISGLLSTKKYGPPVKPPQPALGISAAFGSGIDWQTSAGEDRYRRALYTTWRRSNPYPSMATFDAPNREVCTVRRVRTNTPLQALVTLNDPVFIEAAQGLARRAVAEGGETLEQRLQHAFRLCLLRSPQTDELNRLTRLYEQSVERFRKMPESAQKLATDPIGPVPTGQDVHELAALTVVSNVLLNLDETLMKR